jgi:hypothetical protein
MYSHSTSKKYNDLQVIAIIFYEQKIRIVDFGKLGTLLYFTLYSCTFIIAPRIMAR